MGRPGSGCWPSTRPPRAAASGTALVAACVERARAEGRRAVFLHSLPVMEGAQRIYAGFGFRRVPDRDWIFPGFHLMGFVLDLG